MHRRRRIKVVLLLALCSAIGWVAVSLGGALTNPALGSSVGARFAEWVRGHGGAPVVNWVENEWYSHHPPPGRRQAAGRRDPSVPHASTADVARPRPTCPHRSPIQPFASPGHPR